MKRIERILAAAMLVMPIGPHLHAADSIEILVKGSDTIGDRLGQDLARTYMATRPDVDVRWESIGSSSAFVGLLDGSADMGAASRAINESELERASQLGIVLSEHVLGYDGIAVIVHPSNPIEALSVDQLARLFTEPAPLWSSVGGGTDPVHRISRPSYSGTHAFFRDTVVRRMDAASKAELATSTTFIEETSAILDAVASDPFALSYVGLGFVDATLVKVVPIRADAGSSAVLPSARSIRNGTYPIYRPLFLYVREPAEPEIRQLLRFALSREGRARVAANSFIPSDISPELLRDEPLPDVAAQPSAFRVARPLRVHFGFGSTMLEPNDLPALRSLAASLAAGDARAEIIGHCDSTGTAATNRAVSRMRAETVARFLIEHGAPRRSLRIEGRGSDEPAATNTTGQGRSSNRRVDIFVVSERASEPE